MITDFGDRSVVSSPMDTGQVANQASNLDLAQMRHSFGFGLSLWAGEKQWFKIYTGFASGEGVHPYFGIPK